METKCVFFQFDIIINVLVSSFRFIISYGSTTIMNIFILTVRGSTCRRQILTSKVGPGLKGFKWVKKSGSSFFRFWGTHPRNPAPTSPSKHDTLKQCWATVVDSGPTLNQHCFNVSCSPRLTSTITTHKQKYNFIINLLPTENDSDKWGWQGHHRQVKQMGEKNN